MLRLAKALRDELLRQGGVRVALTREDDRYLTLPMRPEIARRLKADLFISIHADSTEVSSGASEATVYVLSDKGSNEVADRIAARKRGGRGQRHPHHRTVRCGRLRSWSICRSAKCAPCPKPLAR